MKTLSKILLASAVVLTSAITSNAQVRIFVRTRPVEPVIVRPAPPYRGAVWVPGEWAWRGGRYEYVHPHYVRAVPGRVWIPGHWRDIRGGSVWVSGHWR